MSGKTNPRRIPRTEADCRAAYLRGQEAGTRGTLTLVLYTLKEFGANDDEMSEFAAKFNDVLDSLRRGYITEADLKNVLKEEYKLELVYGQPGETKAPPAVGKTADGKGGQKGE